MTIKNRLKKIEEKHAPKKRVTWKNFITGEWEPDPQAWADFVGQENGQPITEIRYQNGTTLQAGIDINKI